MFKQYDLVQNSQTGTLAIILAGPVKVPLFTDFPWNEAEALSPRSFTSFRDMYVVLDFFTIHHEVIDPNNYTLYDPTSPDAHIPLIDASKQLPVVLATLKHVGGAEYLRNILQTALNGLPKPPPPPTIPEKKAPPELFESYTTGDLFTNLYNKVFR